MHHLFDLYPQRRKKAMFPAKISSCPDGYRDRVPSTLKIFVVQFRGKVDGVVFAFFIAANETLSRIDIGCSSRKSGAASRCCPCVP